MFQFLTNTQAGCRRLFPRHLLYQMTTLAFCIAAAVIPRFVDVQVFAADPSRRPNVLLIMTDDQGYGDLHFHGNDKIDTPVLDNLAQTSTRFDRFMVSPLCTMTRASLMTGRYYLRTGVASVTRGLETVRGDETTIAEVLKKAGYATGCFGKWHIGEHYPSHPNGQGFDEFFGMATGHWDNYFNPRLEHNGERVATQGYITDVLTEAAMRFVQEHRHEPFFCYVPYNAPHTPMQVADHYFDKYKARGLENKPAAIYGMVQNIDENVGRLLQQLDDLKIAENTIVIFLSDNGAEGPQGSRFNAGMRGMKGSVHEGGVRVPMFVRWPGKTTPGRVVQQVAAHIDVLPTIASLCGVGALHAKPLDGISLAPLLLEENPPWPAGRMIFTRTPGWRTLVGYSAPMIKKLEPFPAAVRTQRWRMVNEGGAWQLYDMQADPGEKQDVAKSHADVVQRLSTAYQDWFAEITLTPLKRPLIPIGYAAAPVVALPAPEAYFGGSIRWYNQWGFAHDWLTDWSNPADAIAWEADVVAPGKFEVSLRYACTDAAIGVKLRVEAGRSAVEGVIDKSHEPRPVQRPSRIEKKRFTQTFGSLRLGNIALQPGPVRITLKALEAPAGEICDIHSLILKRVD